MSEFLDFLLRILSEFTGGTGSIENNLVRYILSAILWGVLWIVAWLRQRGNHSQREKLLIWGFGLGFVSALLMVGFASLQMLGVIDRQVVYPYLVPVSDALVMASIVFIAGAFLGYILDDARLAHRYIKTGLVITSVCLAIALWQWPGLLATLGETYFHTTWSAWVFTIPLSILMVTAIVLLRKKRDWLTNVVTIALLLFLTSEILVMVNYATNKSIQQIICPIGHSFYLLAILVLGFIYLRENSNDKKRIEKDLGDYRQHLEELVAERTAEILAVNTRLEQEVSERKQVEETLAQLSRRYELILESAGEGICVIDNQGRFSYINQAAAKMLGYRVEELIGQPSHTIWHHSKADGSSYPEDECALFKSIMSGIASQSDEEYFWRKDNIGFPVQYVSQPTYQEENLTGAVIVFRDISDRKQAQAEIAQQNANLAAQNAVAAALSRSLDLEIILETVLDEALTLVKMDAGLLFLWDSALQELTLRSYRGPIFQEVLQKPKPEWSCCAAISAEAIKTAKTIVQAVSECPKGNTSSIILKEGFAILVSIPLISNGRAVGALTLASRQPAPVEPNELNLLTAIGQQIGMAVENAHLYQKAERAIKELTLLHQVSNELTSTFETARIYDQIVEKSLKLLDCQIACILNWDAQAQGIKLVSSCGITDAEGDFLQGVPEAAICQRFLLQSQGTIVVDDAQFDERVPSGWVEKLNIRALLCIPVRGMDESLDHLLLMDQRSPRRWREEERVLIESFVNSAAVALINARLYKQLEWAAALEERQRIAADMHDGLAQTVSLLGLQIDEAIDLIRFGSDQKATEELLKTRETVDRVSSEVRRSIASLQGSAHLSRSVQDLLSQLLTELPVEKGPHIQLVIQAREPVFFQQERADQVLLIVQEALLNAHRHAQANQIKLILDYDEQRINIIVVDDGIGFSPGAWWEKNQDHFGMGIMHSRATRIGADLQIDSAPGQGTRVRLAVPRAANINYSEMKMMTHISSSES